MANNLLTPTVIAKEALAILRNNLVMGTKVHRAYEGEFKKIGDTLTIRKPVKFTVTEARTRSTSDVTEHSITLQVATQAHVSWQFTSVDLTLTIEEYSKRYIEPATNVLANSVDAAICGLYSDIYNAVWESTGFVDPESFIVLGKAARKLDEEAAPQSDRCVVLNPAANWSLANAMKNMYVTDVSKPALQKGYLARIANMEVYMDQNIKVHTTGAFEPTSTTGGFWVGLSGGTGIPTTGDTNGTVHYTENKSMTAGRFCTAGTALQVGDVFQIAGVQAVNPVSGSATGQLRQFVVTAAVAPSATETVSGNYQTVTFEPPMVATGAFKTIDTFPAASAVADVVGVATEPYPQNLAFHKNAFALVMVPLRKPDGQWGSTATDSGFSIRVVKDYDVGTDEEIIRLDILYGVKTLYPELACRIYGAQG